MKNETNSTFIREFFVNDDDTTALQVHQSYIGDVGCVVWDAALVLAKYLARLSDDKNDNRLNLSGAKIVELGSGTGIVGLTAAVLGADVNLTDLHGCIPLIEKNVNQNRHMLKGDVTVTELKWGNVDDAWRLKPADIVLVSDCLYYAESLQLLVTTLKCLCDKKTIVIFSYEQRSSNTKTSLEKTFFKMLDGIFDVRKVLKDELHRDYQSDDIHVFLMKKVPLLK